MEVDLFIYSINDPNGIEFRSGKTQSLENHSDPQATGTNCYNSINFYLSIPAPKLRNAKAGVYDFAFSMSTSLYSGDS